MWKSRGGRNSKLIFIRLISAHYVAYTSFLLTTRPRLHRKRFGIIVTKNHLRRLEVRRIRTHVHPSPTRISRSRDMYTSSGNTVITSVVHTPSPAPIKSSTHTSSSSSSSSNAIFYGGALGAGISAVASRTTNRTRPQRASARPLVRRRAATSRRRPTLRLTGIPPAR